MATITLNETSNHRRQLQGEKGKKKFGDIFIFTQETRLESSSTKYYEIAFITSLPCLSSYFLFGVYLVNISVFFCRGP